MNNQRKTELFIYRFFDWLAAFVAWFLFFIYRKRIEEPNVAFDDIIQDPRLYQGLLLIPLGWMLIYSILEKRRDLYRYSRFNTLKKTFFISFLGVLFLLFTVLLDDTTYNFTSYFNPFFRLFILHFSLTAITRIIILSILKNRLEKGKVSYNTLIIGGDNLAVKLYNQMQNLPVGNWHKFIGFIDSNGNSENKLSQEIPLLGKLNNIPTIIENEGIEEVIIAIESSDHNKLKQILDTLYDYQDSLLVKIIPDMYDIILGKVKMNHIYGAILLEIDQEIMPRWERILKRLVDVVVSVLFFIITLPIFLYVMIRVKFSSDGPIFYQQERIGLNFKPFHIIKFRSMYTDAEAAGPQLSSDSDPRITPWGRVMRKWRLDELPQFFNVLKGDMSLVGPRPERQFYIDKLVKVAPHYRHLFKVRPGITSWGIVQHGYASSIEEMIERLEYDMMYLENLSIGLDFKIFFYTLKVLIQGKGK